MYSKLLAGTVIIVLMGLLLVGFTYTNSDDRGALGVMGKVFPYVFPHDSGHGLSVQTSGGLAGTSAPFYVTPAGDMTVGPVKITEQADADTDEAGKGQYWVNTATPNEAYFTDDTGVDYKLSSAEVIVEAATATLTTSDVTDTVIINTSASGGIVLSLPAAVIGMEVTFFLDTTDDVDINPDDADQILVLTNAVGDAISSDATVGSWIKLVAIDATNWAVIGSNGTWTDVN